MNPISTGPSAPSRRPAVVGAAVAVAVGIGIAQLDSLTNGSLTPWLDVGVGVMPLLVSFWVIIMMIEQPQLHFMVPLGFLAGMALAPLFARPTSAGWFVITGVLWGLSVVARAIGHRRASAVFVLFIGFLLCGLQLSRMPPPGL